MYINKKVVFLVVGLVLAVFVIGIDPPAPPGGFPEGYNYGGGPPPNFDHRPSLPGQEDNRQAQQQQEGQRGLTPEEMERLARARQQQQQQPAQTEPQQPDAPQGQPAPGFTPPDKPGDLNLDNCVNLQDIWMIGPNVGQCGFNPGENGDVTGDGCVHDEDVTAIVQNIDVRCS